MNKKIAIVVFSVFVLFFAACNGQVFERSLGGYQELGYYPVYCYEPEIVPALYSTPGEDEPFFEFSDYTVIRVSDEITITISYLTDEFLAQYETFVEFSQHEFSQHGWGSRDGIAFVSNTTVRNFRYISISGAEVEFIVNGDLFALDELLPETPLLVDWRAMGSMAYGGFAFDDENGVTRYFGFNYCAAGFSAFRWREFEGWYSFDDAGISIFSQLIVETIPQGVDPGAFLQELGYDSYAYHQHRRRADWPDWVALRTDIPVWNLRIISVVPNYEAVFNNGWQFTRRYAFDRTYLSIDLMPGEPFVMTLLADERGIIPFELDGVSFVDIDGRERFFIFRQDNHVVYLEEFENLPFSHEFGHPLITIVRPSPEIELVAAWIFDFGPVEERDVQALANNFLQQFESYTAFGDPASPNGVVIFGANTDLYDFQFFRLGHTCYSWHDQDEWPLFYVGEVRESQAVLPFGQPVVVQWSLGGTWPLFGISFLDESGRQRNFSLNSNEGSGFPPMFITEFTDRKYCSFCDEELLP